MTRTSPSPSVASAYQPRTGRQWLVLVCGVVVFVVLCLIAGRWQWNRYVAREAQIDRIESNYRSDPVALSEVVGSDGQVNRDKEWWPVTVAGHYVPQSTVLLRNRPVGGQAGFHVLVPFVISEDSAVNRATSLSGAVIVIDRGFVPLGANAESAAYVPEPPTGQVTATITLRPDEPASTRDAPVHQVHTISTSQVLAAGGMPGATAASGITGADLGIYGQLRTEIPQAAEQPTALPAPDTNPGSHLSYAAQWCIFALGALVGLVLLIRRDRRDQRGIGHTLTAGDLLLQATVPSTPNGSPTPTRLPDRTRTTTGGPTDAPAIPIPASTMRLRRGDRPRQLTDEEAEDALIAAHLRE